MQVTNGSVTFGRTVKPADYEGKKAEQTLSFTIAEGEDAEACIALVNIMAHDRVMTLLAMPDRAVGAIPMTAPAEVTAPAQTSSNVKEPTKRTRRNPAEVTIGKSDPADIGGGPSSTPTAQQPQTATQHSGDPADISGADPAAIPTGAASNAAQPATTAATVEDWEQTEKEPTEVDLVDACKQANTRIGNPVPIRALIAEYAGPPPKGSKDVPAEKRVAFLAAINALQKAA